MSLFISNKYALKTKFTSLPFVFSSLNHYHVKLNVNFEKALFVAVNYIKYYVLLVYKLIQKSMLWFKLYWYSKLLFSKHDNEPVGLVKLPSLQLLLAGKYTLKFNLGSQICTSFCIVNISSKPLGHLNSLKTEYKNNKHCQEWIMKGLKHKIPCFFLKWW